MSLKRAGNGQNIWGIGIPRPPGPWQKRLFPAFVSELILVLSTYQYIFTVWMSFPGPFVNLGLPCKRQFSAYE